MSTEEFFDQLDERIAKYDLLYHPFYDAWSAGELSREDLQGYAKDYYQHVEAFPEYLAELAMRLDESELRRAVLANLADETGIADDSGKSLPAHSELWLDFVGGVGASRDIRRHIPHPAVKRLVDFFHSIATDGTPEEALAAFYAYESQVPRVAKEKARGLREMYGADKKTCGYFTLHATADVFHANVWRQQLGKLLEQNPSHAEKALVAGENAAKALWQALDGIDAMRNARLAAA